MGQTLHYYRTNLGEQVTPSLASAVRYTKRARIGAIRTDSTGNKFILGFSPSGNESTLKVAAGTNVTAFRGMASGESGSVTTPTWTAVAVGAFAPPTATHIGLHLAVTETGNGSGAMAAPNNSFGALSSITNLPPLALGANTTSWTVHAANMIQLEGTNVFYASCATLNALLCYECTETKSLFLDRN